MTLVLNESNVKIKLHGLMYIAYTGSFSVPNQCGKYYLIIMINLSVSPLDNFNVLILIRMNQTLPQIILLSICKENIFNVQKTLVKMLKKFLPRTLLTVTLPVNGC